MKSMLVLLLSVGLTWGSVCLADDAAESAKPEATEGAVVAAKPATQNKLTKDEAHQYFAVALNNRTWELLGKPDRTPEENREMIQAAYASCYHWRYNGEAVNQQRGEWIISRVYTELEMAEPALYHAQICRELTTKYPDKMKDFDVAYSWECMARAEALNKNTEAAVKYLKKAQESAEAIKGPEDKKIFMGDLNSGKWYGVTP